MQVPSAFERGLLRLTTRLTPPLIIRNEQADIAMDLFNGYIRSVSGSL